MECHLCWGCTGFSIHLFNSCHPEDCYHWWIETRCIFDKIVLRYICICFPTVYMSSVFCVYVSVSCILSSGSLLLVFWFYIDLLSHNTQRIYGSYPLLLLLYRITESFYPVHLHMYCIVFLSLNTQVCYSYIYTKKTNTCTLIPLLTTLYKIHDTSTLTVFSFVSFVWSLDD